MEPKTKQPPGTERRRDERRPDRGPTYGGEDWEAADARGGDRFGVARNDDADPAVFGPDEKETEESELTLKDLQRAAPGADLPHVEMGGEKAGIRRGEKPRKSKWRTRRRRRH